MLKGIVIVFQDNRILPCTAFGILFYWISLLLNYHPQIALKVYTMSSSFFEHASYIKQEKWEFKSFIKSWGKKVYLNISTKEKEKQRFIEFVFANHCVVISIPRSALTIKPFLLLWKDLSTLENWPPDIDLSGRKLLVDN